MFSLPCSRPLPSFTNHLLISLLAGIFLTACGGGGGGSSNTTPPPTATNPSPTVSSVSPSSAVAGAAATTVTVAGTGFIQASTVQWNQSNRATTFVSATQLQAAITAADLAAGGTAQVSVVNPTPGGGTSTAASFTVNNPAPQVTTISPTSVTTVDGGSTLTVNGTGFVSTSSITWNGVPRTTTFISGTQLQAKLLAADLSAVGSAQVAVSNPAPAGGTASPVALAIIYPVPVISSLSPSAVAAGGQDLILTISGIGFAPTSVVQINGTTRQNFFVSSTALRVAITATDIASPTTLAITVVTGTPGGGTSTAVNFTVATFPVPTITGINPTSVTVNSPDTPISLTGSGFTRFSTIQIGSTTLNVSTNVNPSFLFFTIPAANFASVGQLSISVSNPGPSTSNAVTLDVVPNPVPVVNSVFPTSAAVGGPGFILTLSGSNFVAGSVVQWNGLPRPTTFTNSFQLTTAIPATDIQSLGNNLITVFNPAPGGGTSSPVGFTTFLPLPANDLVYNPATQLLYASVPSSGGSALGNSVVSIDPFTGTLGTPIFVGSEPTRLALSNDGTVLWVGLNGASAVREINLVTGTPGLQIGLGTSTFGGGNVAQALSVMPGHPDTVAVAAGPLFSSGSVITIFDSGVARAKTSTGITACCTSVTDLIFDSTGSALYELAQGYGSLAVDSTGITSASSLNPNVFATSMKIDNGRAYLSSGVILDANTGVQQGVFSVGQGQNANGPEVPDSTLGEAFVLVNPNFNQAFQINAYDLSTFVLKGSFPVGGVNTFATSPKSLVRWGQDGLAFITGTQVYILRSPLVKDLSSSLADLNVTATAPASGTTGTDLTYNLTVANTGPVTAAPATLIDNLPLGSTLKTVTPSQGACSSGAVVRCNLGNINPGSSATVSVVVTLLSAGTLSNTVTVAAPQGDPNTTNNTAVSNTTVTGNQNNPSPTMASISPAFVQAGSSTFTLTVNGSGFAPSSTVQLNTTALATTFISAAQLTATVDASSVAALGWTTINVTSPTPGGGASSSLPLSIFQVISLDVNRMTFDPFTRKFYVTIPSTATQVTGNSIASIDPTSGSIGTPLNVGSEPNPLTESQDGNLLYIGLDGSKSLTRVDLTSFTQGAIYPIVETSFGTSTQFAPRDIAVLPGNDNALAILTDGSAGVGIFDVSGTAITARPNFSNFPSGTDLAFPDASNLYAFSSSSGSQFLRWTVDANGLTKIDATGLNGFGGFGGAYRLTNGLAYGFNGGIANPATNPPTSIAQLAVSSAQGPNQSIQGTGVAPDPASGRVLVLGEAGFANPVLLAYDNTTYNLINIQQFTGFGQGADLLRWGRDGVAWHSTPSGVFGNNTPGKGQIVLVRGPFVLPQLLSTNPTPGLASVSPPSVAHGSGNFLFSVSGSNFVPGAVLLWNGAERSTKFVDSSHLTVSIPGSDITQAGTATLLVNNPGSANSSSFSFSIN